METGAPGTVETPTYQRQRASIETYFDRTASAAWAALTSDTPVSRIRANVRRGRESMRRLLVSWLPESLDGHSVLDAGCGTGLLAADVASRGGRVLGIDLSRSLIDVAKARSDGLRGRVDFQVGDMLDPEGGPFDYVVAMDSLIHYRTAEAVGALARLAAQARRAVLFTLVPGTPLLRLRRVVGRLFPKGDRAPAVEPVSEGVVRRLVAAHPMLRHWRLDRTEVVRGGFYTSQAYRMVRD